MTGILDMKLKADHSEERTGQDPSLLNLCLLHLSLITTISTMVLFNNSSKTFSGDTNLTKTPDMSMFVLVKPGCLLLRNFTLHPYLPPAFSFFLEALTIKTMLTTSIAMPVLGQLYKLPLFRIVMQTNSYI